jgi:hypothetical protein
MKISVLIPFKSDEGGVRDLNFYHVKKRYEILMPELELVIGEDDSRPFNRAKARNRAAAKATGDLYIMADADVFFGTRLIDKILAIAPLHPWIVPFSRGYKLTADGAGKAIQTGELKLPTNLKNTDIAENFTSLGALMNVVSRQAFETVGGMDERFLGWGSEDEAFAIALDTIAGKHFRMNETIFHLWHPPAEHYHQYTQYNETLKNRYYEARDNVNAMTQLISESVTQYH